MGMEGSLGGVAVAAATGDLLLALAGLLGLFGLCLGEARRDSCGGGRDDIGEGILIAAEGTRGYREELWEGGEVKRGEDGLARGEAGSEVDEGVFWKVRVIPVRLV